MSSNVHAGSSRESCPARPILSAFNIGKLADDEFALVADHISTCKQCLTELAIIQRGEAKNGVDAQLRQLLAESPSVRDLHESTLDIDASAASSAAPNGPSILGTKIGRYTLRRFLGQGGMGVVYLAEIERVNQVVALKMLGNRLTPHSEHLQRFQTECRAIARLQHPNIVQLFYSDEYNGLPYFTMEYIPGQTLGKRLKQGPLSERKAAEFIRTLALAVDYAHQKSVVHRDLKPGNILLTAAGEPKITDFGLAKLLDLDTSNPTVSEAVLGTPSYMAPEQAAGKSSVAAEAADIYALGVLLYECLTGRPPFTGENKLEIMEKVRTEQPVPPHQRRPKLAPELEAICLKCLEKKPTRRYRSAADIAKDLTLWLDEGRSQAMPNRLSRTARRVRQMALPILLVLGAIVLSGGLYWSDPARPVENIQRQLGKGKTVTLLNKENPKPWYRVRAGKDGAKVITNNDGSITVTSLGIMTLVELLPSVPMNQFSFQASLRHERSDDRGFIGLFVAHEQFVGAEQEGNNVFAGLTFTDVHLESDGAQRGLPPAIAAKLNFPTDNPLHLGLGMVGTRNDQTVYEIVPPELDKSRFEPGYTCDVWRTVTIEVGADRVLGIWSPEVFGECTLASFLDRLRFQIADQSRRDPGDPFLPKIPAKFNPRGGLGLMIYHGIATFKDVTINPHAVN